MQGMWAPDSFLNPAKEPRRCLSNGEIIMSQIEEASSFRIWTRSLRQRMSQARGEGMPSNRDPVSHKRKINPPWKTEALMEPPDFLPVFPDSVAAQVFPALSPFLSIGFNESFLEPKNLLHICNNVPYCQGIESALLFEKFGYVFWAEQSLTPHRGTWV